MAQQKTPRGIRNNNPLNIRKNSCNNWVGKIPNSTDSQFEQFTDIALGIRAAFVLIRNYIRLGNNTPRLIIGRWAPPTENNTNAYINHVCLRSALETEQVLKSSDKTEIIALVYAMSIEENGIDIGIRPFIDAAMLITWT